MTILSKMSINSKNWVLVDYGNDFYAFGDENDLHLFLDFPANQCITKEKIFNYCYSCGTKKEVLKYFESLMRLSRQAINDYTNADPIYWKWAIKYQHRKIEILTEFISILNSK